MNAPLQEAAFADPIQTLGDRNDILKIGFLKAVSTSAPSVVIYSLENGSDEALQANDRI